MKASATAFSWPTRILRSSRNRPSVLGIVVFYATLIVFLNLIVDVLYGAIDPRVRYR